ncbi:fatty acyl-CoA reductase wat-like, partial [Ceratina calcarata]|uniref:Fatty acyl-CoA reductase n=1 Tax=Ceratina calcarata TaxID=156304 RepID=A0AAJ7WB12_9HYME
VFSLLKEKHPKFRHQIVAVAGDCVQPGLGMSAADRQMVARDVSIVFHVAATVRFDEKMKLAVPINVRSPKDVIDICKECSCLKAFVHVSTAYANCPYNLIEEKLYEPPMDADKLVTLTDCMDEKLVEEITPRSSSNRMLKIYKKVHKFMDVLDYFSMKEWKFSNDNLKSLWSKLSEKDREYFGSDIREIDWDHYFRMYMRGIRIYLIKDPMDTLPQARIRWQR